MARPRSEPDESWRPFARRLAEQVDRIGGYAPLARELGISTQAIRMWRTKTDPSADTVERVARVLGVEPRELWDGWDDGDRPGRARTAQQVIGDQRIADLERLVERQEKELARQVEELARHRDALERAGWLERVEAAVSETEAVAEEILAKRQQRRKR